ncbi:MAG: phage portal protein [Rikenellaceae bacterium]
MPKTRIAVTNRQDPYITTERRTPQSDKFWSWGDDNLFPVHLTRLAQRAVTHRRIINDKADYISGKGFNYDTSIPLLGMFVERVNSAGETLRQVISRVAFDKMLFANAFVEVVRMPDHSSLALYHHDASTCRLAKCEEGSQVLIHHNWAKFRHAEAKQIPLYPKFEAFEDGTERSMIHYKDYEPMFSHYGVPSYIAGLGVSAIAYKTDRWNISRLDNSFQMSGVMLLDDTVDSEAEAEAVIRSAEEKFGGKPGQVLFVLKDGSDNDNSRFIPISSQNDGDWEALHDQASADIVVAHSWFRTLSGLDYSSGFSSERILHEYEVALNTVILAEQEELIEPIRDLIASEMGVDASSLVIINRPPTQSKPIYMKVWEARRADGLEYDESDPLQQQFLSQITYSYSTSQTVN